MTRALRSMRASGKRRQAGFTLVEMLVSLGLFSIVMAMVFAFIDKAGKNLETESSGVETQQGARVALEELSFHVKQAGYGIDRSAASNPAAWQRTVLYAGSHAIVFNADLDDTIGAIDGDTSLTLPDGATYEGEGATESTDGAETYFYTLDANGDGRIAAADRWAAAGGSYNPAALTDNPLDYALFRRVYGYDGAEVGGELEPVTPYLFTNATSTDDYADGGSPSPLFTYWLTEDLNRDGNLQDWECVVGACPPLPARSPQRYIWGDTDFDGELSELEKDNLRDLPVGHPSWEPNPLASSDDFHSTALAAVVAAGESLLEVDDATDLAPGFHLQVGRGELAERLVVSDVDTSGLQHTVSVIGATRLFHAGGEDVTVVPDTLLRAIRTVRVSFGAITPERDYDASASTAAPGRSARVGTRGLDYRVTTYEHRFGVPNLQTLPVGR